MANGDVDVNRATLTAMREWVAFDMLLKEEDRGKVMVVLFRCVDWLEFKLVDTDAKMGMAVIL
jgi:hypothetical protein